MRLGQGLAAMAAVVAAGAGCFGSGGGGPERSAESFCTALDELQERHEGAGGDEAERFSDDEIRDLADRAPTDEFRDQLRELASVRREAAEQIEAVQAGEIDDIEDFDTELNDQWLRVSLAVSEGMRTTCD